MPAFSHFALPSPKRRPILLTVAPFVLVPFALAGIGFTITAATAEPGSVLVGNRPVTTLQYLVIVLPISVVWHGSLIVASAGLLLHQRWAQAFLGLGMPAATFLIAFSVGLWGQLPVLELLLLLLKVTLSLSVVTLYFYGYPVVRWYYDRLAER